ncbi:MAG: PAS domain S-box protein, partial [Gammaproteobacteria bacterium]
MNRHPDARKACVRARQGVVLACLLLLCPVIAQPDGALRAPADPELTDLATWIRGRVQLSADEQDWLATRPRVHVRVVDYPPFHFVADGIPQGAMTHDEHLSLRNRWSNIRISGFISREQMLLYGSVATALFVTLLLVGALVINRRMGREIKARRDTERDLKISQSRLREAMEGTETGLWEWNPQTGKVYLDPVWFTMLGYDPDTMPHTLETFEALVHPDDLAAAQATIAALSTERLERFEAEFRMRCSDGSYRWIQSRGGLLETDQDGKPCRLIGIHTDVTRQKDTEQALRNSEKGLLKAQEMAHLGHWEWDIRNDRITWSDEVYRIYGIGRETPLTYERLKQAIHPEDRQYHDEHTAGWLKNIGGDPFEYRVIRPDGDTRYINANGEVTCDESGEPVSFSGFVQDITESKLREQALRESEQRFRRLVEQSPVSIQIHGLDGKLMQSNAAYARLFALNEETLAQLYEKYSVLQDEQAVKLGVMPYIEQTYRGEDVVFPPYEYDGIDTLHTLDIRNPVSRKCWVQTRGFPLKDDFGSLTSVVFMSEDITEQRVAAEQLRISELRFRATFELAAVGIAHVALDGRFLRINRKFCDITGYAQDEMMQLTFQDITYPDDLDADLAYVHQLLEGEIESYTMEKRYVRKDAGLVWISLTGSLIRDAAGQPDWFVAVIQDISERKRAEQAVLGYQQRLKDLSAELARTEVRERRIIATELHDHVGQSLALMRMQLAVARKDTVGRKVDSVLNEVSELLRTAIQDTRNIMSDLSSPELNELGLSAAIADLLKEKIGERYGLQTTFNNDGQVKSLNEYTRMVLFRSVRELLMNVVKHAGASHVAVSICRENDAVRIVVVDDGAG